MEFDFSKNSPSAANPHNAPHEPPGDLTGTKSGTCDHFWSQNPFRGRNRPPVGLHAVVSPSFTLKALPINANNGWLAFFVCD